MFLFLRLLKELMFFTFRTNWCSVVFDAFKVVKRELENMSWKNTETKHIIVTTSYRLYSIEHVVEQNKVIQIYIFNFNLISLYSLRTESLELISKRVVMSVFLCRKYSNDNGLLDCLNVKALSSNSVKYKWENFQIRSN